MKVIKSGDSRNGWSKKLVCTGEGYNGRGCGAVLLVEQDDLFHTTSHCMDETEYFTAFACPECGCLTDTKTSHRPTAFPYCKDWAASRGMVLDYSLGRARKRAEPKSQETAN